VKDVVGAAITVARVVTTQIFLCGRDEDGRVDGRRHIHGVFV
jgi:hypothetical protein